MNFHSTLPMILGSGALIPTEVLISLQALRSRRAPLPFHRSGGSRAHRAWRKARSSGKR